MSWLSKNYEKAALGGAAVIALGLTAVGFLKVGKVEEDFATELKGSGNDNPAVTDADLVAKASASLGNKRKWDQADDKGRPVNLFTGIPLFISKSDPAKPVDPYGGDPIHPPIPNQWWLQYRLDPGFGDSPLRDPDSDGFSNLEEFEAKTDPTNPSDFPALINKLVYVGDESVNWVLRPGFDAEGGFGFSYRDTKGGANRIAAGGVVKPNETFFADGVMKDRFKLLGSEQRMVKNERTNSEQPFKFVRVEDQKPNKKGKIYELKQSFRDPEELPVYSQFDRSAVLKLEALDQGGTEFKIEENTTFGLPSNSEKKDYLLKSVTPEKIEVEYTAPDGSKKTIEIPKR
jgi:hypothetical protein